ncbi:MAG: hypothetical protein DMF84_15590 [Acidobacteria bacterium]|nr:MAG: hypothetical protein DMF84_15590 [Acidobacteriota bacterium]
MTHRRSHRAAHACIAILIAALAVACSGRNNPVDNERKVQGGGERGKNEMVRVEGCLQGAPGTPGREYVLARVTMPEPETQPQGQETMAHGPLVAAGSWVRISPGGEDLKNYVGQRVSITGEVIDRGENTLGTSGRVLPNLPNKEATSDHDKVKQSSRDASANPDRAMPPTTAAPLGANANGNAPKIAVEKISKLAESCEERK